MFAVSTRYQFGIEEYIKFLLYWLDIGLASTLQYYEMGGKEPNLNLQQVFNDFPNYIAYVLSMAVDRWSKSCAGTG